MSHHIYHPPIISPLPQTLLDNFPARLFPGHFTSGRLQPPALSGLCSQPTVSVSLWSLPSLFLRLALLFSASRVFLSLKKYIYLFIWLCQVLFVAYRTFSCGMWDLVPCPGLKLRPSTLGAWNLSHWTSREAPQVFLFLGSRPHFASTHFQESSKENRGEFSWVLACLTMSLVYPQPSVGKLGSGLQSEICSRDSEGTAGFPSAAVVGKPGSCFFIYDLVSFQS